MKTGLHPSSANSENIDALVTARWVIPVEPSGVILENHAIAIHQGKILALVPISEAEEQFTPHTRTDLGNHVILPGLVNAHTHAAMTLLRGFADDLPLNNWLNDRIWPAEAKFATDNFVHDGTLLGAAEMLRSGITCGNDMYFYPEATAKAFDALGMRAVLGITVLEFPTRYANDAEDYLAKGLAARDAWRTHPLINFSLAPHAPYTVSDRTFERIVTLSAQLDLQVHIHVHETQHEVEESLKLHGLRPLARLQRLGLINPSLIAVHAVHLSENEIALLASEGASVVHCPTSNMKLASGISPLAAMLDAGVNVGIGTDGAASNNRLDLLQELRHATLLGKVASQDAAAINCHTAIHLATLGGARSLGLDHSIGSLLPGKQADLCAIRLDEWINQPCFDPASHVVYVTGREQVSDVWVAGKQRVKAGEILDFDVSSLLDSVNLWQNKLRS